MYSLRMSFCVVPSSRSRGTPVFSAAAMYIAQIGAAGELIVIDVLTRSSGSPESRSSMSASDETATPHVPNSPSASGVIGVVPVQRRHVVGDREPRLARVEQLAEPGVRVLGRAEPREHPHGPWTGPVAGRVDAPGERRLAREAHVP